MSSDNHVDPFTFLSFGLLHIDVIYHIVIDKGSYALVYFLHLIQDTGTFLVTTERTDQLHKRCSLSYTRLNLLITIVELLFMSCN